MVADAGAENRVVGKEGRPVASSVLLVAAVSELTLFSGVFGYRRL